MGRALVRVASLSRKISVQEHTVATASSAAEHAQASVAWNKFDTTCFLRTSILLLRF